MEDLSNYRVVFQSIKIILVFFILILCTSCIKDECPLTKRKTKDIYIYPIWGNTSELPEGIRVSFYSKENKKYVQDNLETNGGNCNIREGLYSLILYNNDSEKIFFRNVPEYESHEAYTNKVYRPSFENPIPEEETYDQPDLLWVDTKDSFYIMDTTNQIEFQPLQMVKRYSCTMEAEGLEQVQSIRGAITGMMSSLVIKNKSTGNKSSTIFFDAEKSKNRLYFNFKSFGTYKENNTDRKHILILEFLLPNGIARQNINITQQMDSLLNGGFIPINKTIIIPPDTTKEDGGFDADVGKWDEIVYPIPI